MSEQLNNLAWGFTNRAVQLLPCGIPGLSDTVPENCGPHPDSA